MLSICTQNRRGSRCLARPWYGSLPYIAKLDEALGLVPRSLAAVLRTGTWGTGYPSIPHLYGTTDLPRHMDQI